MKVLVTGASGFIGKSVSRALMHRGIFCKMAIRSLDNQIPDAVITGDLLGVIDWTDACRDVDVVVHCAGRAHITDKLDGKDLERYRKVNVDATCELASTAVQSGAKRFIFVSSIGVNGISTNNRPPFSYDDIPAPTENYAISKWEAEQALWDISERTGLEVIVVRPPLVYGPGAKGNFIRFLELVNKGYPLPFAGVANMRSFVGIDNLTDLLVHCVDHPAAPGETFLVSDNHDLSICDLVIKLAEALNVRPKLFTIHPILIHFAALITSKSKELERLFGSLQIDISHTCKVLGWSPKSSIDVGFQKTADWFLNKE